MSGENIASLAGFVGGGEGEDLGATGEEIVAAGFVSGEPFGVGGLAEEGSGGDQAADVECAGVIEEGDNPGGWGGEEGLVVESGEVVAVFLEEASEVLGGLFPLETHGAERKFDDALDFAEKVVLPDHGGSFVPDRRNAKGEGDPPG